MKFSELRFTKYLRLHPIMHSQWLKDSSGNLWRAMMDLRTMHYKLTCLTPGEQQFTLFLGSKSYLMTAADLQEAIKNLYPDE